MSKTNLKGIEGTHIPYHPDYSAEDNDPLQGICSISVVLLSIGEVLSYVSHHLNTITDALLCDLVEHIPPLLLSHLNQAPKQSLTMCYAL
jgi:hypothetical protein